MLFAFHSDSVRKKYFLIFVVDLFYQVKNSNSNSNSVTVSDMTCQSNDKTCQSSDNTCHSSLKSEYPKLIDQ